jgi:hypothetical protein
MVVNETIPAGFEKGGDPDELLMSYRSRGTGCMIVFIVLCVGFAAAVLSFFAWRDWQRFHALIFAEWWGFLSFAAGLSAAVYFTFFALWLSFGRTEFIVSRANLVIRKNLFALQREWHIPSEDIEYFEQVKDGGEGRDSFPSWGLKVRGRRGISLLARQPLEKSDWLGRILSEFYKVEFRPCKKRK